MATCGISKISSKSQNDIRVSMTCKIFTNRSLWHALIKTSMAESQSILVKFTSIVATKCLARLKKDFDGKQSKLFVIVARKLLVRSEKNLDSRRSILVEIEQKTVGLLSSVGPF